MDQYNFDAHMLDTIILSLQNTISAAQDAILKLQAQAQANQKAKEVVTPKEGTENGLH